MLDISYIHRERFLINLGTDSGKLSFQEATASECFEHYFSLQRDSDYLAEFLQEFIERYSDGKIDINRINIEEFYAILRDTYFKDFFNTDEKNKWEESPFYTILDILAKRVWDPYEFMEKRTWRQVMALIKGQIWNTRAGDKDWDKANRDMYRKEMGDKYDKKDKQMTQAVDDAVQLYLKQKQNGTSTDWSKTWS